MPVPDRAGEILVRHSDASGMEKHDIPREFTTTSRVIIISNDWETPNMDVAALQVRACDQVPAQRGRGAPQGRNLIR
jgi:hypothetical protein